MINRSPSNHDGPGSGLTHVPFGHRIAGMVKSPGVPLLTYYITIHKRHHIKIESMCALTASLKK
jgi:hypothetical protein